MHQTTTYLAPGQRYTQPGERLLEQQVTIIRLESDPHGTTQVIFEYPGGREVVAYVSQVEAAIAGGHLAPIAGPGYMGRC
ncbi:MAG TPA: hypothetical protein VFX03_04240 [Thermomicrobiales bacterium]|nr:hypothetical protein [Thermomicrobiales bacterium]